MSDETVSFEEWARQDRERRARELPWTADGMWQLVRLAAGVCPGGFRLLELAAGPSTANYALQVLLGMGRCVCACLWSASRARS